MLIDATHEEETRVAVVDGNRLVNFDYESKYRKQLKGSIFLAKVTRVEPSLQAAFVNFGGNRHGFLPFSEIHPDYFRIPISDREALIAEQEAEMEARRAAEEAEDEENSDEDAENDGAGEESDIIADLNADLDEENPAPKKGRARKGKPAGKKQASGEKSGDEKEDNTPDNSGNSNEEAKESGKEDEGKPQQRGRGRRRGGRNMAANSRKVEIVGGDGVDGDRPVRPSLRKNYKIQEVVKRGQIMLIQVSREERGNKGAAVTTYLSLPGRYGVLMPNSPRGGGVSRKIANFKDRKRLREILAEFNVPAGMSVIMRTAGVSRTKTEIKRDIDYLMRLWDSIRELTLKSTAPALIHEESNLIRRAIRDIYTRDVEEIDVAGDEGYKMARDFMKMMVPSHVKRVKEYKDDHIPLFHRYQVESQINEIGDTNAVLPSGGYLVINPTEALVSIDVNSGRATRERHIEETALRTNLEAAEEVARQLRLRDLGGLVVIDFIDMEDRRNNRKVENKLKEALSTDRARIQIGRISSFGLLELSRQRLNPSLTEAQFHQCPHCKGAGNIRSIDSATIIALRALEEEGIRNRAGEVILKIPNSIALYILNQKREMLASIERRYGFQVTIEVDSALEPADFKIEPVKGTTPEETSAEESDQEEVPAKSTKKDESGEQDGQRSGRRRGRRGGRRRNTRQNRDDQQPSQNDDNGKNANEPDSSNGGKGPQPDTDVKKDEKTSEAGHKKQPKAKKEAQTAKDSPKNAPDKTKAETSKKDEKAESKPKRGRKATTAKTAKDKKEDSDKAKDKGSDKDSGKASDKDESKKEPKKKSPSAKKKAASSPAPSNDTEPVHKEYETVNKTPNEKKKGWWNRLTE